MEKEFKFSVWVRCLTYNQSLYILDALDGICKQITNFPFVCTVVDDASTDSEPEVIKKYLFDNFEMNDSSIVRNEETENYHLLFARHKKNQNCFFAVLFLKENHYGKKSKWPYLIEWSENADYHAICEGDDYWTDEHKLQRQVDYLENHPDCSAVSENGIELFTETGEQKLFSEEPARYLTIEEMIEKRRFPTASILYRKDAFEIYKSVKNQLDTMLWCILATKGKFYYNAIVSSVYRRGPGVTVTLDPYKFAEMLKGLYGELQSNFPHHLSKKEMKRIVIRSYIAAANRYIKKKSFTKEILLCYKSGMTISPCLFIHQLSKQYSTAIRRLLFKKKVTTN